MVSIPIDYKIFDYDNGLDEHKDLYHEIDPKCFNDIIDSIP